MAIANYIDGKWLYHYNNDRSIIIHQYASVISTCIPIVCFKTTMDFIDLTSKGQLRHPGCMQFSALEKKGSQHRGNTWLVGKSTGNHAFPHEHFTGFLHFCS